jgi:glutathione S-transferase
MVGDRLCYVDLSMFQLMAGLRYAFPRAMKKIEPSLPLLTNLYASVESLPRIAAYLQSKRRLPFNQLGIFRHYPELDLQPARAKAKAKSKPKPKAVRKPAGKPARKAKAKKK